MGVSVSAPFPSQTLHAENLMAVTETYPLFSALDFKLSSGEALWVQGANGSGKSTLLAMLAGLLQPFAGNYNAIENHYIGHDNGLRPHETLGDSIALWVKLYQQKTDTNIDALLELFDLQKHQGHFIGQLSAGQKRKLNLLRLQLAPRPLWLLDEADNALDADSKNILQQWLEAHLQQNGMVVFTNHGTPLIEAHHQLVIAKDGQY